VLPPVSHVCHRSGPDLFLVLLQIRRSIRISGTLSCMRYADRVGGEKNREGGGGQNVLRWADRLDGPGEASLLGQLGQGAD
jgi:hypothetical protein